MKLLIITQKVDRDDPILGFFHRWIAEFAKHCDRIVVICLSKGVYDLPENVEVFSLGKENHRSRFRYVTNFYRLIWQLKDRYDSVFVHMNPEYVVLGGVYWRLMGKKIVLWYTHRQSNLKLWIAEKFVSTMYTASKESFTLKSKKVLVLGHDIDVSAYACPPTSPKDIFTLLQVGRITPIKHCELAIEALAILKESGRPDFRLRFVGDPATHTDEAYFQSLKALVSKRGLLDSVTFAGSLAQKDILNEYCSADITLNLTPTGGVDKAVLESMASSRAVLTTNQTFKPYFGMYAGKLVVREDDATDLARKITELTTLHNKGEIEAYLREKVEETSDLPRLIEKIVENLSV